MNSTRITILISALKNLVKSLEKEEMSCSEEQQEEALEMLAKFNNQRHLSKEQACYYLQISRATFDNLVKEGKIPKGKKTLGFKELSWKQSDLDEYAKSLD